MKRFLPFLLLITNLLSAQVKNDIFSASLNPDSAKNDLKLLRALFDKFHPGEFQHTEKKEFEREYQNLCAEIENVTSPFDLYKIIQRFCVIIKDGHTFADHSRIIDCIKWRQVLPFNIIKIDSKYYVKKVASDSLRDLIGKELISINMVSISDIVKKVELYMDREGQNQSSLQRKYQIFPFYYFLKDTSTSYVIEYTDTSKQVSGKSVSGVTYQEFLKKTKVIVEPVSFDIDEDRIGILHVNTFAISDFESRKIDYKKYFDDVFERCRKEKVKRLIIDVRGNGGGSAETSNYLFSYLKKAGSYFYFKEVCTKYCIAGDLKHYCTTPNGVPDRDSVKLVDSQEQYCEVYKGKDSYWWFKEQRAKKRSFEGTVVVLEDGGCFSTTGHFLALIRNYAVGQIIGDYSHGSYYSNDNGLYFELPYSKFRVRIPTVQFRLNASNFKYNPKGIEPDIMVIPELADIIKGRDVQMMQAKRYILGK